MGAKVSSVEKKRKYRSLLRRDGNLCFWCDVEFSEEWPYTIDHLITQRDGGSNALENLVLACDWCNRERGSMSVGEFRAWLRLNYLAPDDRPKAHLHPNQVKERRNRSS